MRKVRLGKTDMYVHVIGLGCMGLSHASGDPTPYDEAVEILKKAHEIGYDFYDTAQCYTGIYPDGSISYNEEIVGGKRLKSLEMKSFYVLNLELFIKVITWSLTVALKRSEHHWKLH